MIRCQVICREKVLEWVLTRQIVLDLIRILLYLFDACYGFSIHYSQGLQYSRVGSGL